MFGAARKVALATATKQRASAIAFPSPLRLAAGPVRFLNVHEYISMELFKTHGIATPECYVADTPEEAEHIATTALNRRTCTARNELASVRLLPIPRYQSLLLDLEFFRCFIMAMVIFCECGAAH